MALIISRRSFYCPNFATAPDDIRLFLIWIHPTGGPGDFISVRLCCLVSSVSSYHFAFIGINILYLFPSIEGTDRTAELV